MNIYIHLENIIRELDSKLLTGVLAAEKGQSNYFYLSQLIKVLNEVF